MYISEIFSRKNPVVSFEIFPPKKESGYESIKGTIDALAQSKIDYMSVTYGAGGSTSKNTAQISEYLQNKLDITALSHLTCVSATKQEIKNTLADMNARGIRNILALRGDIPSGSEFPSPKHYSYAYELVRDIKDFGGFCIGGACYPEGHPDCESLDRDIENLKIKIDAGCEFLVTQLFFDSDLFYSFMDKIRKAGINVPVTAGIMPLTNIGQIQRMCVLSGGAAMPAKFTRMIAKYQDNPEALKQAGIAYAVDQIIDLLSNDSCGIHIYTMNKPEVANTITAAISSMV